MSKNVKEYKLITVPFHPPAAGQISFPLRTKTPDNKQDRQLHFRAVADNILVTYFWQKHY